MQGGVNHNHCYRLGFRCTADIIDPAAITSVPLRHCLHFDTHQPATISTWTYSRIGLSCAADIIGHVEIDFVALREEGKVRLWAVDLNICASSSLSSFQLFDFLAAGQLDPGSGTYWIPSLPAPPNSADSATDPQLSSAADAMHQPGIATAHQQAQLQGLSEQASSQLADAEVQAALQHTQTDSRSPNSGTGDGQVGEVMYDSNAVAALQPGETSRPWTGEADGAVFSQEQSGSHGGHMAASEQAGNTAQSGMTAMGNATDLWQALPQDTEEQDVQLEPRYYTAIDILFHNGMLKHRSTQFLQSCRLAQLGFDMMARQGLVLNFMDSLSSCCVGLQCAAPTPQAALQGLANVSL